MARLFAASFLVSFFLVSASQAAVDLPPDTTQVGLIDGVTKNITHVSTKCTPDMAAKCRFLTEIELEFTLGCLNDVLVSARPTVNTAESTIQLDVSALELINPNSNRVRCARPNTKVATIVVESGITTTPTVKVEYHSDFAPTR